VEAANEGVWSMDGQFRTTFVNRKMADMLGYSPEEMLGRTVDSFMFEEDSLDHEARMAKRQLGRNDSYERRFRRKDGEEVWTLVSAAAMVDENMEFQGSFAMFTDITERRRTEKALRESEEKFVKAFNCAPALMTLSKADDGTILDINDKFCEVSGFSRAECVGRTSLDVGWLLPEDRIRLIEELQAHGSVRDMDLRAQTKNKKEIELIYSGELMQTASHKLLLSTALDITERNRAEKSRKLLSAAIEQSAEAVIITDAKGIIQYVNPAQEILSGYNRDELIGRTPNVLETDFHHVDFHKQLWDTISVGEAWSGRLVNKKKDGAEYHEDATISPIYDHAGNLTNLVVVQHDVTKQIELQEQLFQAQKMEAIGTLAGGFAHDFNNKLQVIAGYVELMLCDKDIQENYKHDIGIIKQAVDSSAELIKGMMVFSRKTPIELQPIDLNKLVAQTGSMLARSISKIIEIDLLLADDLWAIKAAPNQIDQILMNLAVNARDAMPGGGKLTIQTKNTILDEEYCRYHPNTKPGPFVLLSVTDTGSGMDEATVKRIFEPFFTTKEEEKGTGLGLAVVYGIVEQHGARIICDSAPSVGTTFRIYFPAIEKVHQEEYFENKEPPRGEGETILLVDDEPHLRDIVARQLVGANYRVIKASNGNEALKLYEQHRKQISLIILDLLMPGMGGKQCLEALRKLDPNVRVLVATGHTAPGIVGELEQAGAKGFIRKPFETNLLLEKIREIVDED
jgi:PAS domain S-box-containing protein